MEIKPLRGGSWDLNPRNCRSAFRDDFFPRDFRDFFIGFRLSIKRKKDVPDVLAQ